MTSRNHPRLAQHGLAQSAPAGPGLGQRPPRDIRARLTALIMMSLLLLAFALRTYYLDFQSLEGDEGISLLRSSLPLGQMLEVMPNEHVPGYFVLLHFWLRLIADHDFALRYLSVWPSVLAVALIFRLATDLGLRSVGIVAALLLATSAFQIWYAQQARMYSWLLATALLSNWFLWLMLERGERRPALSLLGYILSTAATIHIHYYGFLVPVTQTVFVALWWWYRRDWRLLRRWIAAGIGIFLLFLSWLPRALNMAGFQGWRDPVEPWRVPWLMLAAYTVSDTMPQPGYAWLPWIYLALATMGIVAWWKRERMAGLFLTLGIFVPMILILMAVVRNPDFHERYTIFLSTPILVAAGLGILGPSCWKHGFARHQAARGRSWTSVFILWPAVLTIVLVGANGFALNRLYHDASLHKADFRAAALTIEKHAKPGDIILVDGPNPELVFNHYYRGVAPVYDLRFLLDATDAEVDEALHDLTADAGRAWELLYFKEPGPVQVWLATRAWPAKPSYHNGIRVTPYGLAAAESLEERPLSVAFGTELELLHVGVSHDTIHRGDMLRISTHWFTHEQAPNYRFSLRLQDTNGQVVANWDYVPQNWFAPTNVWVVGQPATDQHALFIPDTLASGRYQISLRLYDPATGAPVETAAGQNVTLAEITVVE